MIQQGVLTLANSRIALSFIKKRPPDAALRVHVSGPGRWRNPGDFGVQPTFDFAGSENASRWLVVLSKTSARTAIRKTPSSDQLTLMVMLIVVPCSDTDTAMSFPAWSNGALADLRSEFNVKVAVGVCGHRQSGESGWFGSIRWR